MRAATTLKSDMAGARSRHNVRGSSLLDELTAVVVLSVGLLGLAGLQGRVQSMATNAENQTLAITIAQNQLERLRGIAGDPAGAGYGRITGRKATIEMIGDQRLETPFAVRIDVQRFQLEEAGAGSAHYRMVADDAPAQVNLPEFKRVNVTVAWTGKTGAVHSVSLPGVIGPATTF